MFNRVSQEQLEAALIISRTPYWQQLRSAVDEELLALYRALRDSGDTVALGRLQGSIKALEAVRDLIEKSQDTLDGIRRRGAGSP